MAWVVLAVAGLFEAGMVLGLNFSEGFTKLWGSLLMVVSGGISFYLLSVVMQTIPAGTAYAVWTAIGASVAVLLGILFLVQLQDRFWVIVGVPIASWPSRASRTFIDAHTAAPSIAQKVS
jgi:quaternary ammonium compound-resistance protein SugE